ncbi:Lrp/AsnC family transcriptional regulator [Haladaptatus pallidirubidus]|uniref:Lrp/AsnC family transcriptional regulator n=2 Tax=Haladaptatus pallidirubidus TaxID=1008152 RepID=A0AAV3URG0_9EURY
MLERETSIMTKGYSASDDFDEVDLKLLTFIEDDFDVSLDKLSDELELSKSAVHYRLNKMKESGVIKGITADLNPEPFELDMVAITEVSVTHEKGYSTDIGNKLADINGVEQVYYTMGDVDFMVLTRVQDRNRMNEVIDQMVAIDGVNETSSRFVMDEVKNNPKFMDNFSQE